MKITLRAYPSCGVRSNCVTVLDSLTRDSEFHCIECPSIGQKPYLCSTPHRVPPLNASAMPDMLPVELLYVIIFYFVDSRTPGRPSSLARDDEYYWHPVKSLKPEWHEVQPLTLVSKVFREIALEAWFQTFALPASEFHLCEEWLPTIPGVLSWTRTLHWITPYEMSHGLGLGFFSREMDLTMFTHLRKVQFDAIPYDDAYDAIRTLGKVPPTVHEFEMRYHLRPSPDQLVHMPDGFPNLQVLDLHQERAWCSLCNTCNLLHLDEIPPSSVTYNNGDGLPVRPCASL